MKPEVVLIEFTPKGRIPWMVFVKDEHGMLGYYIEQSRRARGLYAHCWAAGVAPYLEGEGRNRWWAADGYEPKNDQCKGRKRMKKPPQGRFSPGRLFDSLCGEGDWCSECDDFIPEGFEHDPGCPYENPYKT